MSARKHDGQAGSNWTHRPGMLGAVARFWQRTYAPDYIGILLLLGAYIIIQLWQEPFHRLFSLDDRNIQYPHAEIERVPVAWLGAFAAGLPISSVIIWTIFWRPDTHRVHVTFLALSISLILTSFLTDITKNTIGRPRPDLLSRCKPKENTPTNILVSISVCTETAHHLLQDGWRSFPSGHSSAAFSGLGFLSIFICGQSHALRPRTNLISLLLTLSPLIGAALIAISRLEDYRHDPYDVTAGSTLGLTIAYLSYRRYFPPLKATKCDKPFALRAESMEKANGPDREDGYGLVRGEALILSRRLEPDEGDEAIPLRHVEAGRRDLESGR